MSEQRFRCFDPAVVTVSWTGSDGAQNQDYAPLHEVWASGGQVHVDEAVEPGTRLHVVLENGAELIGQVEACVPDDSFGYIVDLAMEPQHLWRSGPQAKYFARDCALSFAKAS